MINDTPRTSPQSANVPDYAAQPRNMRLTPRGAPSIPMSRVFPEVRAGQCEFCGTLDPNQPGDLQYKLCPHYRGMDMKCIYCPQTKDQDEVVRNSILKVREHPYHPGELVVWCQSFECLKKFEQMFPA